MFTYQYLIIKNHLATSVPELREIEWYTGQDLRADKNASLKASPGAYFQFFPTNTEDLGGFIQSAEAEFDIILLSECMFDDDKRVRKDEALDHMALFDKIFRTLHGFSAKLSALDEFADLAGTDQDQRAFASLTRISVTPPGGELRAIMRSSQRFQGIFYDHAAVKTYTTPAPAPSLEISTDVVESAS